MKKIISILVVVALILPTFSVMAQNISIEIDGKKTNTDVAPIEEDGCVLVPVRVISENLGAEVLWDDATRTVTINHKDSKIIIFVGNSYATINGKDVALDVPAKIVSGRTLVPVRFVSEALGCVVDRDSNTETVRIKRGTENMLNGKKIIFIGDSNIYWGKVVDGTSKSVHEQSERENDKGLFYQICKANGAEVNVLDWAWGSHGQWSLLSGEPCTLEGKCKDLNHLEAITDKNFDYVVIGLTRSEKDEGAMLEQFEHITKIFKEANPNVKIIALAPAMIYGYNDKDTVRQGTIDNLKVIEEKYGVTIVDWGRIVKDIVEGNVKVEGATCEYNRNTFVVTKDNKHPSLLAGYITSLMTYCAITGEKAEGQPYDFFFKEELASTFGIPAFVEGNYANAEETTMEEIFNSEADMKGLQQLVDKYIAEKSYRN